MIGLARGGRGRAFVRRVAQRFSEENLDEVSASLAFTTLLSLVPLVALSLSLATLLPAFPSLADQLDRYLVRNLLPEGSAGLIARYILEFSHKAARVTVVGLLLLAATAFLLLLTIERAFNNVWGVTERRRWWQRLRLYSGLIVLWPLALGAVAAAVSYAVTVSLGLVDESPWLRRLLFKALGVLLPTLFFGGLYYVVPNVRVRVRDAAWAGFIAALAFVLMQKAFEVYLQQFPSYQTIYGAFSTVPIFLIWLYLSWAVVLLGALLAATLPEFRTDDSATDG
ncbi:YihY family inner membrane protein [Rhodocyclus tenuis]|uniref:YihY family inner membrane protein n=2 Tax=Rhodocyclus TaxID=1064 RepID=A0A6L5JWC8_RHOTE|nr:YihY family inner membrane protein [Rhodocyclus gracilis]MQY51673.1 YihY family inner membrane protein [Rhodocyclus gracilis]MRD73154.1 YihY family inner membrane protein [Rhodocyclus gracilis]NJA89066.1 YihY family inner membrane protein [Rhodocyclus gracilis]